MKSRVKRVLSCHVPARLRGCCSNTPSDKSSVEIARKHVERAAFIVLLVTLVNTCTLRHGYAFRPGMGRDTFPLCLEFWLIYILSRLLPRHCSMRKPNNKERILRRVEGENFINWLESSRVATGIGPKHFSYLPGFSSAHDLSIVHVSRTFTFLSIVLTTNERTLSPRISVFKWVTRERDLFTCAYHTDRYLCTRD